MNLESLTEAFALNVWGLPLVIGLVGSGVFFTIYCGFPQLRFFRHAINIVLGKYDKPEDKGEINHFQALTSALSATVGLGNIAGVAVAIATGGPGAVFWLWVTGFIGMTTKFVEVTLSLSYRDISSSGKVHGGPMYVIKKALPKRLGFMAVFYAFFVVLSSMGAGNMFQANQMSSVLLTSANIPTWLSGIIFAFFAYLILIGGIKRIGTVTSFLVPVMIGFYFLGAIGVVVTQLDNIPHVLMQIFEGAFMGTAALGGFAGAAVKDVIIQGIRRASFSNEAGMGSAAMAHSAAKSSPVKEGLVSLLEPFIDTIVVCSITAFALLLTDAWHVPGIHGSEMTAYAFESVLGIFGRWIVTLTVTLFAFSTIISWSYYGEQGVTFLFGEDKIVYYRWVFLLFIFIGSVAKPNIVLNISDAVYGLLAIPNIIACYFLLPKVKAMLTDYERSLKNKI